MASLLQVPSMDLHLFPNWARAVTYCHWFNAAPKRMHFTNSIESTPRSLRYGQHAYESSWQPATPLLSQIFYCSEPTATGSGRKACNCSSQRNLLSRIQPLANQSRPVIDAVFGLNDIQSIWYTRLSSIELFLTFTTFLLLTSDHIFMAWVQPYDAKYCPAVELNGSTPHPPRWSGYTGIHIVATAEQSTFQFPALQFL